MTLKIIKTKDMENNGCIKSKGKKENDKKDKSVDT